MPDVVPHRVDAEIQLACDLTGRAAVLEQPQDLALAWRQMRMRRGRRLLLDLHHLAEDADHATAPLERDGADLDGDTLPVGAEHDPAIVRSLRRPVEVAKE